MSVLDQVALELYRHRIHNLMVTESKDMYEHVGQQIFWKEFGAFVSIMARQSGKTRFLETVANNLAKSGEKVLIIATIRGRDQRFLGHNVIATFEFAAKANAHHEHHLIIDEFTSISRPVLNQFLDNPWKSVTMAGSLK